MMSRPHLSLRVGDLVRARVVRVAVVLLALLVAVSAQSAGAYWSADGTGSASTTTGTLAAPLEVDVPRSALGAPAVDWTPSATGVAPEGYYVTRHPEAAGTPPTSDAACASSPTLLLTTTGCTDVGAPDGEHSYVVTAVYRSWTARSEPSGPVSVVNANQLRFVVGPTTVRTAEAMSPPVRVAVRTADDAPFARSGIAVTLSIHSDPATGTLAGVTTVGTDGDGVASFPGLSVDEAGVGYTLTATSPGLAGATSQLFDVTPPPLLGAAGDYSVLAYTSVVNTGATTISGDVGVSPGSAATGFPPGLIGGDLHLDDAHAAAAQQSLAGAYAALAALEPTGTVTGDLNGLTVTPGVYRSTAALALTGTLTLDAQGEEGAVFVFQVGAAFDTAAASTVHLVDGARAANVYWVVSGAAGTGASSYLSGSILAQGAVTLGEGTVLIGRALSRGTVTLAATTIRFSDALAPTITIDGGDTAVTKDVTPTITGTTSAPSSPVKVTVAGQTLSTSAGPDGTWSVTSADLPARSYQVMAQVRAPSGDGAKDAQLLTVEVNPDPVDLGAAAAYSVLASTAVVGTGVTHLSGDLGVSPANTVTGFGPGEGGTLDGTVHAGDLEAAQARADLVTALTDASGRTAHTTIVGDLAGRRLRAGVHHSTAALALTGTVTLDGEGDPDAVFVLQTDAAFDTAAASTVDLVGGARAANVYWVVAGAAGTGASTVIAGSILARGAVTLGAGTQLEGRALSLDTVTLASNRLTGVAPAPAHLATTGAP